MARRSAAARRDWNGVWRDDSISAGNHHKHHAEFERRHDAIFLRKRELDQCDSSGDKFDRAVVAKHFDKPRQCEWILAVHGHQHAPISRAVLSLVFILISGTDLNPVEARRIILIREGQGKWRRRRIARQHHLPIQKIRRSQKRIVGPTPGEGQTK